MTRSKLLFGFSLVELMVAVGIVTVLVTLALPRYRLFMARSRMAEAKTNLGIIYGLQQTYKAEFEQYGTLGGGGMGCAPGACNAGSPGLAAKNELGFRVTDCNALRYHYTTPGGADGANANADGSNSQCQIYNECTELDAWQITNGRKLLHAQNVISKCDD